MPPQPSEQVVLYWSEYLAGSGFTGPMSGITEFGGSPEQKIKLANLALAGTKCATTGPVREYDAEGEPIPEPGDHYVVVDGSGTPRCVYPRYRCADHTVPRC